MSEVLLVNVILLVMVVITAAFVVHVRSLFSAVLMAGIYSLFMALVWTNMHALDVAFTEAAVGAGISTVLLLGAISRTTRWAKKSQLRVDWRAVLVCAATGSMLIYGTLDMPEFGDPKAPIHNLRVPDLIAQRVGKTEDGQPRQYAPPDPGHLVPNDDFGGHVPNTVTSLLAAYRGYDTMFETVVIFTAGVGMVLLLRRQREEEEEEVEAGADAEVEAGAGAEAEAEVEAEAEAEAEADADADAEGGPQS